MILVRRIHDLFEGELKSEHVKSRFSRRLHFRQLVDIFIHFRRFHPEWLLQTQSLTNVSTSEIW